VKDEGREGVFVGLHLVGEAVFSLTRMMPELSLTRKGRSLSYRGPHGWHRRACDTGLEEAVDGLGAAVRGIVG